MKKTIPLILIKWLKDQVTKRILDNNVLNETSTNKQIPPSSKLHDLC